MPSKNIFFSVLLAGSIVLLSACSPIPETSSISLSEKSSPKGAPDSGYEINFSTKDLSVNYLKRKINTWLDGNSPNLVKEINYSRANQPQLLRDVVASQPDLYTGILDNTEVEAKMEAIPAFSDYVHSLDPNPFHGDLNIIQSISSSGAYTLEPFVNGSDHFIAINNYKDSSASYNIDSVIYKWNGSQFVPVQSIPTHGASSIRPFTIGGSFYIAISNLFNGSSYNIDSVIYRWNGTEFIQFQTLATQGNVDFEYFIIGTDHYLAAANFSTDGNRNINSKIYKWDGTGFAEFQSIPTRASTDVEFIMAGNEKFLAFTSSDDNGPDNLDTTIYKWDGTTFNLFQAIPSKIAYDTESFVVNGETYLAIAILYDKHGGNVSIDIYKWNGSEFAAFQSIANASTEDLEPFTMGGIQYLAGSNSKLYKWDGSGFIEYRTITTGGGCTGYRYFTIGSDNYLAGAHPGADSQIYKLD
jgi:hypothetical protein